MPESQQKLKTKRVWQRIILAILPGLVVAGFLAFATRKTSITTPTENGLVGYWNMDNESIYGTTLYDKSGNGNNGTIYGATTGVSGKIKQALSFDGEDDYVQVPDSPSLDITNAITLEAWEKRNPQNIIFSDGFESGNFSKWDVVNTWQASFSVVTTEKYHGTYSAKGSGLDEGGDYVYANKSIPERSTYFVRIYVLLTQHFNNNSILKWLIRLQTTAGPSLSVHLQRESDGFYRWVAENSPIGTSYFSSPFMLDINHWYCVELKAVRDTTNGEMIVWIDGSEEIMQTGINTGDYNINRVWIEAYNWSDTDAGTVYWDSVVVSDTYIGPDETISNKGKDTYGLEMSGDGSTIYGYINNNEISASVSTPTEWHHYVMTYDGSNQKLYIDGVLATSTSLSGSINTSTSTLKIGEFFSGQLDEVRIYNRALSAEEVKEHYLAGLRKAQIQ